MSKGLEFELDVRTVYKTILNKIGKQNSGEITISTEDFCDFIPEILDPMWKLQSNEHLDVILLQIEKESNGKFMLPSYNSKRRPYSRYGKTLFFDDYSVAFFSDKPETLNDGKDLFLSMKGEGAIYYYSNGTNSKPIIYELSGNVKRYILSELSKGKKATSTATLRKASGSKNISREINELRIGITKKLHLNGNLAIPVSKAGTGYTLGESFTLTKRNL